jgi:hypothetical protein
MEWLEPKTENNHEKMEVIQQNTEASAILGGTAHRDSPRNTPKKKTDQDWRSLLYRIGTNCIENTTSKSASIAACLFTATEMCLPHHCLAVAACIHSTTMLSAVMSQQQQ